VQNPELFTCPQCGETVPTYYRELGDNICYECRSYARNAPPPVPTEKRTPTINEILACRAAYMNYAEIAARYKVTKRTIHFVIGRAKETRQQCRTARRTDSGLSN